ncbi:MAG: zf-HC2 domain-containing protein [Blautia marasmi]
MSEKGFCPAVRDLLPLYGDGALSQETEELISRHLRRAGVQSAL